MPNRKPTEVRIPGNTWLIRYHDQKHWHSVREEQVMWDMKRHFHDWEHQMWIMREGAMEVTTPYACYMYLRESAYQDEVDGPSW